MSQHPMTHRARLLAEEFDGGWLILSLCDALDGEYEELGNLRGQLDAALCDMADGVAGNSDTPGTEWGTDHFGGVIWRPSEESARKIARDSKTNLYSRPPMGRWVRVESYEAA